MKINIIIQSETELKYVITYVKLRTNKTCSYRGKIITVIKKGRKFFKGVSYFPFIIEREEKIYAPSFLNESVGTRWWPWNLTWENRKEKRKRKKDGESRLTMDFYDNCWDNNENELEDDS